MRLIYQMFILFLLTSAAAAQLAPDKERFDVVLHPGEVEEKTLEVTNIGDAPISKITSTPVSGSAKDFIFLGIPEGKALEPNDKAELKVFIAVPPETAPGSYTGFIYLLDSTPPSMPIGIEFDIQVVGQESYGLSMTIDDAKSASKFANADDIAQFDLSIKNLGRFRDVASIGISPLPEGWTVNLKDGEREQFIPYDLPLDPGITHSMKLLIQTTEPGKKGNMSIKASSLSNQSNNVSVDAEVEFGMAVRGYNFDIEVPEKMVANKTYKGFGKIILEVKEKILVGIVTPPNLMIIPLAQVVEVTPDNPGIANFTMLASQPGTYPMIFKLIDSNGVPMPEETTTINVGRPVGIVVLTGDDFLYSTVASLCSPDNKTLPVMVASSGKLSDEDQERLQAFAKVVILGNESVVSSDAEKALQGIDVKRIEGENICETTWRFTSELWQNGTSQLVLSSPKATDIFRAYQVAKLRGLPLVVCDNGFSDATKSIIEEMTKRNVRLSKVFIMGKAGEATTNALKGLNISIEEVAQ